MNGASVSFSHIAQDGDRISVYPVFESFNISGVTKLRERPLRRPKFIVDKGFEPMLGARPLRRAIERNLEDTLSTEMLKGRFPEGTDILADVKNGELKFTEKKKVKKKEKEVEAQTEAAT